MSKPEVLITGANGEVGHGLIKALAEENRYSIIALDRREMDPERESLCEAFYQGDILDDELIQRISQHHRFHKIFHLAGLLSSSAEKDPDRGHMVNVEGSRKILSIAKAHGDLLDTRVIFLFTSSIAAYGVRAGDDQSRPLTERQFLTPTTMYGINKLYVEQLGYYYSEIFEKNAPHPPRIDFRCLRFPGLISPDTIPSGGTSDYGPEMLHAAACGEAYACFVAPDTKIPFMVMEDAVRSILMLASAPAEHIRERIYNVTAFSVSAAEIEAKIRQHFHEASITYEPAPARQAIVDSWPNALDDKAAQKDWRWSPLYDFEAAFEKVLIPKIRERYRC